MKQFLLISLYSCPIVFIFFIFLVQKRQMFYGAMLALEDEESQRRGYVVVIYSLQQQQKIWGSRGVHFVRSILKIQQAVLIQTQSAHYCYDNYIWLPVLSLVQSSSQPFTQLRYRFHYGTLCE